MVENSSEALVELAERVEKAEGADREIDWLVHRERHAKLIDDTTYCNFGPEKDGRWLTYRLPHRWPWSRALTPRYTADLNAAMSLIDASTFFHISRFDADVDGRSEAHIYPNRNVGDDYKAEAATPALALVAAALRARSAATA